MTAAGVALAAAAAAAFEVSYVVQALEARRLARSDRARLGLLASLIRRPLWVFAMVLSISGFGLQVLALRQAPLSIVQPVLALGLLLLLALSQQFLGERVGRTEAIGAVGVIAGITLIVIANPRHGGHASDLVLAFVCVPLGLAAIAPFLMRRSPPNMLIASAALSDALYALATNEVARASEGTLQLIAFLFWWAVAGASGGLALTAETNALQHRAAGRVAPVVLAGQIALPVALAPLVAGDDWSRTPGHGALVILGLLVIGASVVWLGRSEVLHSARAAGEVHVAAPHPLPPQPPEDGTVAIDSGPPDFDARPHDPHGDLGATSP